MRVTLLVSDTEGKREYSFSKSGEFTIGRSPEANVVVADPRVSKEHTRLMIRGMEVAVRDCHSSNGTIIDGVTYGIERQEHNEGISQRSAFETSVRDGSQVQIGSTNILINIGLDDKDRQKIARWSTEAARKMSEALDLLHRIEDLDPDNKTVETFLPLEDILEKYYETHDRFA